MSGSHLQLSSGGSGDFTDITLDTETGEGDEWVPVIPPPRLPPMPLPEASRELALDWVGRSVLHAAGRFEKVQGPRMGKEYLDSLRGYLRDLPQQD